jgi:cytochrome c6
MAIPAAVAAALPAEAAMVSEGAAAAVDPGDPAAGARLFEAHCVGCHLGGGNIIRRGRTLKLAALQRADLASPQAIARVAAAGIGQMSGYGAVLGPGGSEQVAAWVWEQAQAGWPSPAQPRRRDTSP